MCRLLHLLSGCLALATALPHVFPASLRASDGNSTGAEFFERKVRPVFVQHCYACHSAQTKKHKGGLELDSKAALLKGGDTGPVVVPGLPERSRLIEAIRYKDVDLQMPPMGKLPDQVIADLTAWVKMGAPWPDQPARAGALKGSTDFDLKKRKAQHWAWHPIRTQAPPAVRDCAWPFDPVDCFILARLEQRGLSPARQADRRTLLRRAYLDLIGLPPSPQEAAAFLNDPGPGAWERVVDRLLASPHFGERWGRHWLDLARYAETRGHEYDAIAPNAYQYRDYVIRALNADVPYNQFVMEQVAGDVLADPRLHPTAGFNESILGTGFWLLGEEVHSPVDLRQDQADRFDNRIDVFAKTFLGLTVACARCHDHKFDAISAKDYYALFGILEGSNYRLVRFDSRENNQLIAAELAALRERQRPVIQRALAAVVRPTAERLDDYLLAARECILSELVKCAADVRRPDCCRRIQELATARHLDVALLARWVSHLLDAAADASDPFHHWAKAAQDALTADSVHVAQGILPVAVGSKGERVVLDYATSTSADWMPDDVTFGPGPVRPGELLLRAEAGKPVVHFAEQAAAVFDRTWDGLQVAPDAQSDAEALGRRMRAGRTIRTPSFAITGKVFCLLKGTGLAYLALDSHTLIAGPLHGKLVVDFRTDYKLGWVAYDVAAYKGHWAHLELTAGEGADLAVVKVVQGTEAPNITDAPLDAWQGLVTKQNATSLHTLAVPYRQALVGLTDRLAANQLRGAFEGAVLARLANWALAHGALLNADPGAVQDALSGAAAPYVAAEQALMARATKSSRLAMALQDGNGIDESVFVRGSPKALGETVPRRFLEALAGPQPLEAGHGSGRLELARQLTDPVVSPLTPRVMVNRIWQHLFGRGIVPSVDNFGVLGEAPSHPELLDYLAAEFVRQRWSIKTMVRRLALSKTYQMSSLADHRASDVDPQNALLHRMRLRRLEGEAIRDALLAVSARLDGRMFGPSVPVYLTPFMEGRGRPPASGPLDGDGRRSVYIAVRRNFLSPTMLAFDTPIPFSTVGRRTVSNVPAQALILLNDPFVHQQAAVWARRVCALGGSASDRVRAMYEAAFCRLPTEAELKVCLVFLENQAALGHVRVEAPQVWTDLAHTLFNVKEFIFLN
jgi:hypothetical protein